MKYPGGFKSKENSTPIYGNRGMNFEADINHKLTDHNQNHILFFYYPCINKALMLMLIFHVYAHLPDMQIKILNLYQKFLFRLFSIKAAYDNFRLKKLHFHYYFLFPSIKAYNYRYHIAWKIQLYLNK